ncbi:MAG: ATP-binding protein [Pyrinomonadaceae bacterium]
MTTPEPHGSPASSEERVLVLAPTGKDAVLTCQYLGGADIFAEACDGVEDLCHKLATGVGAALLPEEALTPPTIRRLVDTLSRHPTWSQLPLIVLTGGIETNPAKVEMLKKLSKVATVTLIERPVRVITLVTAFQAALHARQGQYDVRDYLIEQKRAQAERTRLLEQELKAQRKAKSIEHRYQFLAESIPAIVWTAQPNGSIDYYNQRWFEYTGMTLEQTSGWGWQPVVHPDDIERCLRRWARSVATCEEYQIEYRFKRVDGSYRWHLGRATPMLDESGQIVRWFGTCTDIDDQKRAEEEAQAARKEAQVANDAKDEFLATLSHELRTPLTSILGWAILLRSGKLNEENVLRALETIERSARAQNQLINDLLDISRVITGKFRLDVQLVNLALVIAAATDAVRPAAEAKNIRLQVLLDPQAPPVSGDPDRLQQVVWNLLTNAVKFTPQGGQVQVQLERIDSNVEITVSDTGRGISAEFLPLAFDRFRQADQSTTREHSGIGLGLAIVRQMAELHGGMVRAASAGEGQGASFTVTLPIGVARKLEGSRSGDAKRAGSPAKGSMPMESLPSLKDLKVLIVDDESDTREMLTTVLEQCQAQVTSVATVSDGLEAIERAKPDILVSDIGMPGEDGYVLIRRVRSLPAESGGGVQAIALTAYARVEDRMKVLAEGYQMHMPKPVDLAEFVMVIASLAGWKRGSVTESS